MKQKLKIGDVVLVAHPSPRDDLCPVQPRFWWCVGIVESREQFCGDTFYIVRFSNRILDGFWPEELEAIWFTFGA